MYLDSGLQVTLMGVSHCGRVTSVVTEQNKAVNKPENLQVLVGTPGGGLRQTGELSAVGFRYYLII